MVCCVAVVNKTSCVKSRGVSCKTTVCVSLEEYVERLQHAITHKHRPLHMDVACVDTTPMSEWSKLAGMRAALSKLTPGDIDANAKIAIDKQLVSTALSLTDAMKRAKLPSKSDWRVGREFVFEVSVRMVEGKWSQQIACGWAEVTACAVALTALTGLGDGFDETEGQQDTTFLARVDAVCKFARDESLALKTLVTDREKRDAVALSRPAVAVHSPDVGGYAKWQAAKRFFFNHWSESALGACLDALEAYHSMCPDARGAANNVDAKQAMKTARAAVKVAIDNLPSSPWQKPVDLKASARAALKDDDDDWNLGTMHTEPPGVSLQEGARRFVDSDETGSETGDEAPPVAPQAMGMALTLHATAPKDIPGVNEEDVAAEAFDYASAFFADGEKRVADARVVYCVHKSASPSSDVDGAGSSTSASVEIEEPRQPRQPRQQKKRLMENDSEDNGGNGDTAADAKYAKLADVLHDAAVSSVLAYGKALHGMRFVGGDEAKNIGWAILTVGDSVRDRLKSAACANA